MIPLSYSVGVLQTEVRSNDQFPPQQISVSHATQSTLTTISNCLEAFRATSNTEGPCVCF